MLDMTGISLFSLQRDDFIKLVSIVAVLTNYGVNLEIDMCIQICAQDQEVFLFYHGKLSHPGLG